MNFLFNKKKLSEDKEDVRRLKDCQSKYLCIVTEVNEFSLCKLNEASMFSYETYVMIVMGQI